MKKILLALFAVAFFASSVTFVYAQSGATSERDWMMTHDVGKMLGTYVTDRDGLRIAQVKDFVSDRDGRITFAILSYRGRSGAEESVAVPNSLLFYNEENNEFITDLTKDRLASAPRVHDRADLAGHEYAGQVYRYFGVQPSWESGGSSTGMGIGE